MSVLLTNWHFMRIVRAGIALWAFSEMWRTGDWMLFALGMLFGTQAVFNTGCCGSAACNTPQADASGERSASNLTEDVTFEEVK